MRRVLPDSLMAYVHYWTVDMFSFLLESLCFTFMLFSISFLAVNKSFGSRINCPFQLCWSVQVDKGGARMDSRQ